MRNILVLILSFALSLPVFALDVTVQNDNGTSMGNSYVSARNGWEESTLLFPDGPCKVKTIQIYYTGDQPARDTIWVVGYPTSGNLYPTQYIWHHNTLIEPIVYDYDGTPGWKDIDVSGTDLRSDGFDKIVIQHILKANGPWFAFDNDGRNSSNPSWMTDPITPNPNFYGIVGTIYAYPAGDYMVRLVVEYLYPKGESSMPPPAPKFVNMKSETKVTGGGYPAVADWNNDGWDDIALGGSLFQNNGDGTFENISEVNALSAQGTSWADYDNDGDLDCYTLSNGTQNFDLYMSFNNNKLYKNDGTGKLTAVDLQTAFRLPYPSPSDDFVLPNANHQDSIPNPYNGISNLWMDYENDGWLDLFIANRRMEQSGKPEIYCPDQLWKSNQDGTFSNVRTEAGIPTGEPMRMNASATGVNGYYDCYGANACDYNKDNFIDIFVANYRLAPDNLYKNNGDGTFVDVGQETGARGVDTYAPQYFGHGMGSEWGDFNNDTYMDLAVGNLAHTDSRGYYSNPSLIFRNEGPDGNYHFEEVHHQMGLKFHEGNAGINWADFNLDGWLDIWHGVYSGYFGRFYLNQGAPDFKLKDITWDINCVVNNSWTAVRLDYDHDGDIDMVINGTIYRNDLPHDGKWIAIRLSGSPDNNVNMDTYGTKVTVFANGQTFYRELGGSSAGSLCTQNTNELHFGLGDIESIKKINIEYPNGEKLSLDGPVINARYKVEYMSAAVMNGLATPALQSPENFETKLPADVTLVWNECGFAENYTVQLSDQSDFSNILYEGNISGTDAPLSDMTDNNTFYWRVKAHSTDAQSSWSSVWNFTIGTPIPSAPVLISPQDDTVNVNVKTTFDWHDSEYPTLVFTDTEYQLQIATDESFGQEFLVVDLRASNSDIELSEALEPGMEYYWRVRGINEKVSGEWSVAWNFSTMPLPDKVILTEPSDGETNVDQRAKFKWSAAANSVTYDFELAKDEQFTDIAWSIEKSPNDFFNMFKKLETGVTYYWHVRGNNDGGPGEWSNTWSFTVEGEISVKELPKDESILLSCSPNPFSEITTLKLHNKEYRKLEITVMDERGKRAAELFKGELPAGDFEFDWAAGNMPSGKYYIVVFTKDSMFSTDAVLVK